MKVRYFQLARKIAQKSPSKYKMGCVIIKKSKIITVGFNNMAKTSPHSKSYGNFLHAEIDALIGTDFDKTNGGIAYIYRDDLNGKIAMAKPCDICHNSLKLAGIKKVCYSTREGFKEETL